MSMLTYIRKRAILQIVFIVILLLLIIDIFVTGYLKYSYDYLKCGQVPIAAVKRGDWAVSGYSFPSTSTYKIRAYNTYYCTSTEAEEAGEKPNPFSEEGYQRQEQLKREGKL